MIQIDVAKQQLELKSTLLQIEQRTLQNALHQIELRTADADTRWENTPLQWQVENQELQTLLEARFRDSLVAHSHRGRRGERPLVDIQKIDELTLPLLQNKYQAELQGIRHSIFSDSGKCGMVHISIGLNFIPMEASGRISRVDGVNEVLLYHGTATANLATILEHNLDHRLAGSNRGKMFGEGIYFASNASKADLYTRPEDDSNTRAIIIARVCLGKPYEASDQVQDLKLAPSGYHSVRALTKDEGGRVEYPEYIVYKDTQVLPLFVVFYQHQAGCKCTHCGM